MLLGHSIHIKLTYPHFTNATVAFGHKGKFMPPSVTPGARFGLCTSGTPGGPLLGTSPSLAGPRTPDSAS